MGGREIPYGDEDPDYILTEEDDEILTDPDIEYWDGDPYTPWDDPTEEIAQLTKALDAALEQRDSLASRIDSYRELMQDMADKFVDERQQRKALERALEEAYAYLVGVRCAVRDTETGAVSLVKVPLQMPEGGAFV